MHSQKIDSHVHILDPKQFPYAPDVWYEPIGAEQGTASDLTQVMVYHGVQHALLVQPNSGYSYDNRAMLSAIAKYKNQDGYGRFKGMAIVKNNASLGELQDLQSQGIVGIAMNAALLGLISTRTLSRYFSVCVILICGRKCRYSMTNC